MRTKAKKLKMSQMRLTRWEKLDLNQKLLTSMAHIINLMSTNFTKFALVWIKFFLIFSILILQRYVIFAIFFIDLTLIVIFVYVKKKLKAKFYHYMTYLVSITYLVNTQKWWGCSKEFFFLKILWFNLIRSFYEILCINIF